MSFDSTSEMPEDDGSEKPREESAREVNRRLRAERQREKESARVAQRGIGKFERLAREMAQRFKGDPKRAWAEFCTANQRAACAAWADARGVGRPHWYFTDLHETHRVGAGQSHADAALRDCGRLRHPCAGAV